MQRLYSMYVCVASWGDGHVKLSVDAGGVNGAFTALQGLRDAEFLCARSCCSEVLFSTFMSSCFFAFQGDERQRHSVDHGGHEWGVHGAAEPDEAGAEDEPHQVHHQPGLHRPEQPAAPPPGGQRHHHHPGELLSAPAEAACAVSPRPLLAPFTTCVSVADEQRL